MIERVVEDWLTSVSERHFEVPFAQLLERQGSHVIHLASPHGPMEQGKDIIAIDANRRPVAFQLKSGNLNLDNWRNPTQPLKGQVEDLLDLPIQHPSVRPGTPHTSYLVTTGLLDETLRQTIVTYNLGRLQQGKSELFLLTRGELSRMILDCIGTFLPGSLAQLRDFLKLWLSDGRSMPARSEVAGFLAERARQHGGRLGQRQLKETSAELVLLATYLASPYQQVQNHISEIEVWTLCAAQLLYLACRSNAARKAVTPSLSLVEAAIDSAFERLIREIADRTSCREGDQMTDSFFYRFRTTHVVGFVSAAILWSRWRNGPLDTDRNIDEFLEQNRAYMRLWGEGAIPSYLATGWALEHFSGMPLAEALCFVLSANITGSHVRAMNERNMEPQPKTVSVASPAAADLLASPYIPLSTILDRGLDMSPTRPNDVLLGFSYCLESLITVLALRLRRQHLSRIWHDVTRIVMTTYVPAHRADLWLWHNGIEGYVRQRWLPCPSSWAHTLHEARNPDDQLIPALAKDFPHLLLLFVLVAPHRLNSAIASVLERTRWDRGPA